MPLWDGPRTSAVTHSDENAQGRDRFYDVIDLMNSWVHKDRRLSDLDFVVLPELCWGPKPKRIDGESDSPGSSTRSWNEHPGPPEAGATQVEEVRMRGRHRGPGLCSPCPAGEVRSGWSRSRRHGGRHELRWRESTGICGLSRSI